MDWTDTPLGPPEGWPQSLRTAVSICLQSRFPILIWWGPHLVKIYNDAYRPILGDKHPRAMGQAGRECWAEIWDIIGPMLASVRERGEATWSEDQMLPLARYGFVEECYFTYSYSPIRDETGGIGGVFCAVSETTGRVIGERRLRMLRDLSRQGEETRTADDACANAARTLADNPGDLPFALLYLIEPDGGHARLAAAASLEASGATAPRRVALHEEADTDATWPLRRVLEAGNPKLVSDLVEKFGALPGGPWPEPAEAALIVPIAAPGQAKPTGFLVAGLSPRLELDAGYRGCLDLVAGHIGAAIANARAYEEERRRAEALAEIDRAKTAFFSNVSHELRTPLTLMMGPLEDAIAEPGELSPRNRERLELAHRSSLRLLKLVNTLLEFSRIEAGRIQAAFEPVALDVLTAELASVFRAATERAGVRLVVDCPPLPEAVHVDRDMWEKIVLNLVSNAFKFTFEGEIEVKLDSVGGAARLCVRDTGVGIPPEAIPRIFERFYRVENTRSRTQEGTGIGLALVQELVRLHGGTIGAESRLGVGTTFTVTIPLGTAHLPPNRAGGPAPRERAGFRAMTAAFADEAMGWLPGEPEPAALPGEPPANPTEGAPGAPRPRVLLADDNADMRGYLARLLAEHYDVDAVGDGLAALEAARRRAPDLILSDVMMPRLDGFGLIREVRADPALKALPVILLSARAGEESRVDGLQRGADDYLIKPFSARELLARVGAQLGLAQLRRESTQALQRSHAELTERAEALRRFNEFAVGRELRMIELKKEINALCEWAGQPPRYPAEPLQEGTVRA
jgi:signal transduction histidine kinase/DNA-binding response OmpR family regulator